MYTIKPSLKTTSMLTISQYSTINQDVYHQEKKVIRFGVRKVEVEVVISDSVKDHHIFLSENVINHLEIPLPCIYDIFTQGNEIRVGPFIGILTEKTNKRVAQMLPTYKSFVKAYHRIGGAIIVFSLESIREEDQTVSGFLYRPDKDYWIPGRFPYPTSIMSILEASLTSSWEEFQAKMKHFISILGPKVFNYPHFSKWEMYNLLNPKLAHALPETILYTDHNDVSEMLYKHDSIYIKPLYGRLAKYIFKVTKTQSNRAVQFVQNRKKQRQTFTSDHDLFLFLEKYLVPDMFLIQQTIPLMEYKNRVIDFRVMMVKNEIGVWENLGVFSRYGAKGDIVSNVTSGGNTEMAENTLQKVWGLSKKETETVKVEIDKLVRESLTLLEQNGYHCGNIGFDIGLGNDGSIFIIEINHQNPDPYIAWKAKNRKAFYLARFKNMLYAKYLEEN